MADPAVPGTAGRVHVVAGLIENARGEVLIARRPPHAHQGDRWEFPGGKLEPGEEPRAALARELHEELGVHVEQARPCIRIPHDYPDKRVLLDVWRVLAWHGAPHGREGQPVAWVAPERLTEHRFPEANRGIVAAARLPDSYLITPDPGPDADALLAGLGAALAEGARLVQLRAPSLPPPAYRALAIDALAMCRDAGARLLLNASPVLALELGAHGVHLNARRLRALEARPPHLAWVGASCHDAGELALAAALGADFAVLSPVNATPGHPDVAPLGWERFAALTQAAAIPVYALGGVGRTSLETAWRHGAQGVAGIRALWPAHP